MLFLLLRFDSLPGNDLIGNLSDRIDDQTVITLDVFVVLRLANSQVVPEPTAIEERQGDSRAYPKNPAFRGKDVFYPDGIESRKGKQVHVGIKGRLCLFDPLRQRLDPPQLRHNIWPTSDQFRWKLSRQGQIATVTQCRSSDRGTAVRACPGEGGELVT